MRVLNIWDCCVQSIVFYPLFCFVWFSLESRYDTNNRIYRQVVCDITNLSIFLIIVCGRSLLLSLTNYKLAFLRCNYVLEQYYTIVFITIAVILLILQNELIDYSKTMISIAFLPKIQQSIILYEATCNT